MRSLPVHVDLLPIIHQPTNIAAKLSFCPIGVGSAFASPGLNF